MFFVDDLFTSYARSYEASQEVQVERGEVEMTLVEYMEIYGQDPVIYSTKMKRMLAAIGEPAAVDEFQDINLRAPSALLTTGTKTVLDSARERLLIPGVYLDHKARDSPALYITSNTKDKCPDESYM